MDPFRAQHGLVNPMPPLTLGTVALGQAYGNVVHTSLPSEAGVRGILDAAWGAGLMVLDTARAYGLAEDRIGAWAAARGHRPTIITKLPPLDRPDRAAVEAALQTSLAALRVDAVAGYMVHRSSHLHIPEVAEALREQVAAGRIGRFGASVYDVAEAEAALGVPGIGLLQVPASLLDRRMAKAGLPARAAAQGVTVFARSLYTQGVLFADPVSLPVHFAALRPVLRRLREIAAGHGVSLAALALQDVLRTPGVASAVVGLTEVDQIAAAVDATQAGVDDAVVAEAREAVGELPDQVIDPRQWPPRAG